MINAFVVSAKDDERKGEIASNLVLSSLLSQKNSITDEKNLKMAFDNAKIALEKYVAEDPDALNMGCTASGIIINTETVICFNIGDCRVYRIQNSYFEKITHDHSVVQSLFDEGLITEDDMRHHPRKNAVTSSVSGDRTPGSLRIYMASLNMRNPDVFFLCSDGIWECFSHDELEMIYQRFQGYAFCEKILTAALARRASDNISGILVIISAL